MAGYDTGHIWRIAWPVLIHYQRNSVFNPDTKNRAQVNAKTIKKSILIFSLVLMPISEGGFTP